MSYSDESVVIFPSEKSEFFKDFQDTYQEKYDKCLEAVIDILNCGPESKSSLARYINMKKCKPRAYADFNKVYKTAPMKKK